MSGFIRVDRDIWDDDLFPAEPMTQREAWLWLQAQAAWADTNHFVAGERLPVKRGQVIVTIRQLQSVFGWRSDKRVRGWLNRLENASEIGRKIVGKRTQRKTQITICNYNDKQGSGRRLDATRTYEGRSTDALKKPDNNKQTLEAKASLSVSFTDANEVFEAVSAYNEVAKQAGWPKVQKMNPTRVKALKARLKGFGGLNGWRDALRRAYASDFIRERWPGFGFDSLISQQKFTKLIEGSYDNRNRKQRLSPDRPSDGTDSAIEQIARLAGLNETPRDGGGGTGGHGEEDGPVRMGAGSWVNGA